MQANGYLLPANEAANHAHVLIRRRVKLIEDEQNLTLSIDLVNEDDRWQVVREVIFVAVGQ